jgi:leucyl-tRNA synthetase
MGKSLKNGVSPEEMYRKYGADTLRLYEMAMGPLEVDKPWRTDDVIGVHRFLQRLWRSMVDEQTGEPTISDTPLDAATERALHTTITAVRRDFGLLRFNTAIARLMELVTVAARVGAADSALPRTLAEPLVLMVAPLAPHVAEELWAKLGHAGSLAYEPFPEADPALAQADTVTVPVQVNGRTRFRIEMPVGSDVAAIEDAVRAHAEYARWTGSGGGAGADGRGGVDRMVVVPGRIVNIILR